MISYNYNAQKQPPAPFVVVTLRHPQTGAEARDVPAQIDTGADQTLVPAAFVAALGLYASGAAEVGGVGGHRDTMDLFDLELVIRTFPPHRLEVLVHPGEPWVLLGRDVLNGHRVVLDGPNLMLEVG